MSNTYRYARLLILLAIFAVPFTARADEKITCYTGYDDEFFFIAAVIEKPSITASQTAYFSDPLKDDSIVVFLQADEPVGGKRSAKSVELAVSAAGGAQLYRGANAVPLKGFTDFLKGRTGTPVAFKMAVTTSRAAPARY